MQWKSIFSYQLCKYNPPNVFFLTVFQGWLEIKVTKLPMAANRNSDYVLENSKAFNILLRDFDLECKYKPRLDSYFASICIFRKWILEILPNLNVTQELILMM